MDNRSDISRYGFIHGDPRLEAALEIAELAHGTGGKPRRHGGPYIEHPLMVAAILDRFGCSNKQVAVGLLHDVVEERKDLFGDIPALETQLYERLKARCRPRGEAETENLRLWARDVCHGVEELTNGAILYEGKRTWQVNHVPLISPDFRPVKIIDQAASVIDDILGCDPRDAEALKKAKGFALKGLDVSRACRDEDRNNPFHEFYKRIYSYFIKNYELAQAGDFLAYTARQGKFDVRHTIAAAKAPVKRRQVKAEEVVHYYSPGYLDMKQGLARITLSKKEGVVVGFGAVASPEEDKDGPANKAAQHLCEVLEERKNVWVSTGKLLKPATKAHKPKMQGLEQHAETLIRDYTLPEPLPLDVFLGLAGKADAITSAFRFGKLERLATGEIEVASR